MEPRPAGPDIARAFGPRIDALPAATQRALIVAAADDSGELVRALRVQELALAALDAADEAGLVAIEGGRLEFVHPLIRTTAYRKASPNGRREAHAALAAAMRGDKARRARRAWHLAAATLEPDERVARELERVAAEARGRAAPGVAGRALEAAARVSHPGPERMQRLLSAAWAQHDAGAPERAIALLDTALAEIADPRMRADAQSLRAQIEILRRPAGLVRALLIEEADRVERHDAARAAAMRLEAALASEMMGEPRTALELAERAWPAARTAGPSVHAFAAMVVGACRLLCGDARSAKPLLREAVELVDRVDPTFVGLTVRLGLTEMWFGHQREGRALLQAAVTRIRKEGTLPALPTALFGLAYAQFMLGEWRSAEATANESLVIAGEVGQSVFLTQPDVILALVAGSQGRIGEGRAYVERALEQGSRYGSDSVHTMAGWALGRRELGIGDFEAAVAALEPTGQFSLERGPEAPSVAPWAQDLAEAYVRLGRREDADATLRVLERQAVRTEGRQAHAGALRCRGLLSALVDRGDTWLPIVGQRPNTDAAASLPSSGPTLIRAGRVLAPSGRLSAGRREIVMRGAWRDGHHSVPATWHLRGLSNGVRLRAPCPASTRLQLIE